MKNMNADDVWLNKKTYDDAEQTFYENLSKEALCPLAGEVIKLDVSGEVSELDVSDKLIVLEERLLNESRDTFASEVSSVAFDTEAFKFIEKKVVDFEKSINQILDQLKSLTLRVSAIEKSVSQSTTVKEINLSQQPQIKEQPGKTDDDDDVDLFASDSEEENAEDAKIREARLAAYAAKKSKKPALIAKSNIILDVKPWDDETDMKVMENEVRKIKCDGLLWGASKLVPLAFGIHKLQIATVVEDDKVSIDWLTEQIEAIEDYVQSVDIAAFNKI